jgi:hypothetical protein
MIAEIPQHRVETVIIQPLQWGRNRMIAEIGWQVSVRRLVMQLR